LFEEIAPDALTDNIFKLVGADITVITAGAIPNQNSMAASWGGFGIIFNRPAAWLFLRANRYTLEKIRAEKKFTLTYFAPEYKNDVLFFGSKTGRGTDKMKESKLTPLAAPSGLPAYREARLIFECELVQITTVAPDDFALDEGKKFVEEGFADAGAYHKLVTAAITKVWRRK
jgi:flavin reductase (DIM6/NTAB) family NADH-FMN oxidoreductase RutF